MKKLFYFLIAIPLLFIGCKDDETPEACSAFLDCSSETLWKMDITPTIKFKNIAKEPQQTSESEEIFVEFKKDQRNPIKVWGKEFDMTCYYDVWENNQYFPSFEIMDNGKKILKLEVDKESDTDTFYEIWTFEVSEDDSKIDLKIESFEDGETDTEFVSFSKTMIKPEDIQICM